MKNDFSDRIFTNADQEVVEYAGQPVNWRVSAYALIIQDESLLIIKNKNEKLYDVPGGGVEISETIEEALDRELIEEAGAKAEIGKLIHLQEGFFKHGNGNFYQTIQLFYLGKLIGKLTESTEGTTEFVGFVKLNELDTYPVPKAVKTAVSLINQL